MSTEDDWRSKLTPEQFQICREKGTEAPFSGDYNSVEGSGVFHCVCCGTPLFETASKYDSGSGWPSFWAPISDSCIQETVDLSHGMRRVEITCSECDAHLGHVFTDGPAPTGLRYCVNSISLRYEKE
ncbi:MAG: peptide-methionine (R)-S-oxide reductase MsrB [Gammaproteobacteria bacterium]|nr:peptide-methionine (R)-S-oxide reductase MsrB [Gammaproteobacteria bacterium]